ncbi:hypothetical protein BVI2075_40017 [Burkholderia vietnamiensis]|nr:hypothetical protein BVI2075_40017 [Burkholderia vietnamiensis]
MAHCAAMPPETRRYPFARRCVAVRAKLKHRLPPEKHHDQDPRRHGARMRSPRRLLLPLRLLFVRLLRGRAGAAGARVCRAQPRVLLSGARLRAGVGRLLGAGRVAELRLRRPRRLAPPLMHRGAAGRARAPRSRFLSFHPIVKRTRDPAV